MSELLTIYTISHNTCDYPGKFVVRQSNMGRKYGEVFINHIDPPVAIVDSLNQAREAIPDDLQLIPRSSDDDPVIAESYM